MNHEQLFQALDILSGADVPCVLWSSPGSGKTDGIAQWAALRGREFATESAAFMEPTDHRFPWVVDGKLRWLPPPVLERLNHGRPSVWLFDDFTAGLPTVQRSLCRLLRGREVGDVPLPQNCYVMLAANFQTDAAATEAMPTSIRNRICHLGMYCEVPQGKGLTDDQIAKQPGPAMLESWTKWALANGIRTETIGYHRWRSGIALYQFDKAAYAWPSMRSWEMVSRIGDQSPSAEIEFELIAGCVGVKQATEYAGYLRLVRNLPAIEAILMAPSSAVVPTDPSVLYALATALARKSTAHNFDAVCQYLERIPPEFSVLCAKDALKINESLGQTRAFVQWATAHKEVML